LFVVVDAFYPIDAIIQVAKEFRQKYPGVALRIYVEALGGAIKPVLDGRYSIGVIGSLPEIPDTLTTERLPGITFLLVAARNHPLTSYQGKISKGPLSLSIIFCSTPFGAAYRGIAAGWFDFGCRLCDRPTHRLAPLADGLSIA
jgi:DNA-binding transcriptional LysR family regulator